MNTGLVKIFVWKEYSVNHGKSFRKEKLEIVHWQSLNTATQVESKELFEKEISNLFKLLKENKEREQ